jgi:transketolase
MLRSLSNLTTSNPDLHLADPISVRRSVLTMLYRAKASHLGSNMSVIEMLVAMYASVDCQLIRERKTDRSRIFISKGHCAAATYATLAHYEILPMNLLETYHMDGSKLAGHVSHTVDGVEHSTGALGHGINVALGCAIGLRSRGHANGLVLTLVGDGEIQEGSVWEAMMLAVHMKLNNFITLVDNNRISSISNTEKVIDMRPLKARFEGFGLNVHEVNGHDVTSIMLAIEKIKKGMNPGVIICNTIKGYGVPFAEWQPIWHYKTLSFEQYTEAIERLDKLKEA